MQAGVLAVLPSYDAGILLLRAAHDLSKPTIGESPVGRGAGSPFAFKEAIYSKHVPSWTYPPLAQELAANGAVSVYSDQGAAGAATRKTVEWKVTGSIVEAARAHLGTLKQARHDPSAPSLVGGEKGD
jgi:hypothetical protein